MSHKKILLLCAIFVAISAMVFVWGGESGDDTKVESAETEVRATVAEFGRRVSSKTYQELVSADLLKFWAEHPEIAPENIFSENQLADFEILEVTAEEDGAYSVQGKTRAGSDEILPLAIKLRNKEHKWIITGVSLVGRTE